MSGRVPGRDAGRLPDHSRGWRRVAVPGERPRPLLELVVIAVMFGAYKLGRIAAAKHVGTAFDNAYVVWDLERLLRLPDELSVQGLMLHNTVVTKSANIYYAAVHFPATALFLIWLYLRRPGDYLWVRRTLALLTASGLLVHLAIPVAPPRMLAPLGFVDTAAVYGPAVYGPPNRNTLADQYAAMPSLHIGWAVMVTIGIIATTRTRWRWLAVLHPVATTLVVIGTANHFWLDGMVALSLLAASLIVVRSISEPRIDVPDFVPVLASPAVLGLSGLPNRMPAPQRRLPAGARPSAQPLAGVSPAAPTSRPSPREAVVERSEPAVRPFRREPEPAVRPLRREPEARPAPRGPMAERSPRTPMVERSPRTPMVERSPRTPMVERSPRTPMVERSPRTPMVERSPHDPAARPSRREPVVPPSPRTPVADRSPHKPAAQPSRREPGQRPSRREPGQRPSRREPGQRPSWWKPVGRRALSEPVSLLTAPVLPSVLPLVFAAPLVTPPLLTPPIVGPPVVDRDPDRSDGDQPDRPDRGRPDQTRRNRPD